MVKKKDIKHRHGTAALVQLDNAHIDYSTVTYEHDADHMNHGFGLESASQLNADPRQVFKTLLVDIGERPGRDLVTAVVPVTAHVNLKAVASACGVKKASMADPAVAQRQTGYVVGGISPFGHKTAHQTLLDQSAIAFDIIYVSGGRRGLSVGIKPDDLVIILSAKIAPIAADGSHPF